MSRNNPFAALDNPMVTYENLAFDWNESSYILVGTLEDFEDDSTVAAKNMAYLGRQSIKFIESHHLFGKQYRIELRPNQSKWNLYLHIDSVAWFDALIMKNYTQEQIINKGRIYVDGVRNSYSPSQPKTSKYTPVAAQNYCPNHSQCVSSECLNNNCILSDILNY
jgi:hypothetical protein